MARAVVGVLELLSPVARPARPRAVAAPTRNFFVVLLPADGKTVTLGRCKRGYRHPRRRDHRGRSTGTATPKRCGPYRRRARGASTRPMSFLLSPGRQGQLDAGKGLVLQQVLPGTPGSAEIVVINITNRVGNSRSTTPCPAAAQEIAAPVHPLSIRQIGADTPNGQRQHWWPRNRSHPGTGTVDGCGDAVPSGRSGATSSMAGRGPRTGSRRGTDRLPHQSGSRQPRPMSRQVRIHLNIHRRGVIA